MLARPGDCIAEGPLLYLSGFAVQLVVCRLPVRWTERKKRIEKESGKLASFPESD
jgi:hypothetical protein